MAAAATQDRKRTTQAGWVITDAPGLFGEIDKNELRVHDSYQRNHVDSKCVKMAKEWSWIACGVIMIGERDGEFWVIDGQHRVMAARKRNDITTLPCMVFETTGIQQDATGFLACNTNRKPVSSYDKYRAGIVAGDKNCKYVDAICTELGITLGLQRVDKPLHTACIGWLIDKAAFNRVAFRVILTLAAELCQETNITVEILRGLACIHNNTAETLNDPRLRSRILSVGAESLIRAAKKSALVHERNTDWTFGLGMITEVNKGLHKKFVLNIGEVTGNG